MYFPKFGCLILHQCNTERSGTEMEERSREHFPMFGCLILHQRNTKRSGTEMEERSRECILQCSVALFYSFPLSLSPFRSVPFRSVFPGNIEIIFYFLSLPPSLRSAPLRSVFPDKKWNGTEWNGMKWKRMDQNKHTRSRPFLQRNHLFFRSVPLHLFIIIFLPKLPLCFSQGCQVLYFHTKISSFG